MTCPHCNGFWLLRIGALYVWCDRCDDAAQKRAEDPEWLYFANQWKGRKAA